LPTCTRRYWFIGHSTLYLIIATFFGFNVVENYFPLQQRQEKALSLLAEISAYSTPDTLNALVPMAAPPARGGCACALRISQPLPAPVGPRVDTQALTCLVRWTACVSGRSIKPSPDSSLRVTW
jgi:hypothetical protein